MCIENTKKMLKKITVFCCLFLLFQNTKAQVKDSVNDGVKYQIYQLSNGEMYTYKKPKFLGMIVNIPKDVVGTVHNMGEKSNLVALGTALVTTVALLPADQYLLERSREIGDKLGMEEVARYKNFGPLNNIPPNFTSGNFNFFFEKLPFHKTSKPSAGICQNRKSRGDGGGQIFTGCTECGS